MYQTTFATLINCMDGRAQSPAMSYLKSRFGVDYVDSITEAGPVKIISENIYGTAVGSIKDRVEISSVRHGSKHIAVAGHHDCAGNPVDKSEQVRQIKASVEIIKSWGMDWNEVIGLWIDENFEVSEV